MRRASEASGGLEEGWACGAGLLKGGPAPKGLLVLLAACHAAHVETPKLHAGTTISVYDTYAVIDDRREIDLQAGELVLDKIDPGASLASLMIESDLHVGVCHRELPAGVVRCEITGTPGHHVVRVAYVSSALRYRADHELAVMVPGHARVVSHFAVDTPAWGGPAELILYDGAPGGDRVPREVARGVASLDGTTAVLAAAPRDVPATLTRVFDGALLGDIPPTDAAWGKDSQPSVWVWLELQGLVLARGPMRVHVELPGEPTADAIVPAERCRSDHGTLRAPLWVDADLQGTRARFVDLGDGAALAERLVFGVANTGAAPREVWIEEHLRPARARRIERAWPTRPVVVGDIVRTRVVVKPGAVERTGFTIAYDL
jgi:hypothetical protein